MLKVNVKINEADSKLNKNLACSFKEGKYNNQLKIKTSHLIRS